ncbi:MAG: hypothetical protein WCP16_14345 [Pseudanabaena sp. ELA645]|jgi:hypothetical protein
MQVTLASLEDFDEVSRRSQSHNLEVSNPNLKNSEGEEFFITYINVQSVLPELVAA